MKLLLITYSFPPAAGVGVLRAHSLARYLPESGIEVEVLTARNAAAVGQDPSMLRQLPEGTVIHRSWALDLPFALRKTIKHFLERSRSRSASSSANHSKQPQPARAGNPIRRLLADLLLPDPQVGWLPFATRAACSIIRRRGIDAVLITVPPFSSSMLVSRLRKAFPSLPIVLDFRDEWLQSTIDLVSFNSNARAREVASRCERAAVTDATRVVCVTEAAVRAVRSRYPEIDPERFVCVPNGYDRAPQPASAPEIDETSDHTVTLTYTGTIYGTTDPTQLVEAVLSLPEAMRSRLRLRFIGHIETPAYRATLERLGGQVELLGFIPQAEALRALETTDYVLLITHDPINVAAKLYDYISSGKPILAAVHPEGDVRRILEQTQTGWWADGSDSHAIAALLQEAIERAPLLATSFHPATETIAQYHRRPLTARYAALLRSLLPGA